MWVNDLFKVKECAYRGNTAPQALQLPLPGTHVHWEILELPLSLSILVCKMRGIISILQSNFKALTSWLLSSRGIMKVILQLSLRQRPFCSSPGTWGFQTIFCRTQSTFAGITTHRGIWIWFHSFLLYSCGTNTPLPPTYARLQSLKSVELSVTGTGKLLSGTLLPFFSLCS